uniref:NADH-ubiquinone oxidoreductase chain 4 n=1 Tax=Sepia latimanus TaxID=3248881 RepID=T2HQ32_SEPLA|nr:NADH dehydrogenase subunit 4 [Sepia latimanus]QIC20344.1 NADH dehydrogenase subunit 4 [Sepia latimanus]BAN81954.1 NADH dehydrogenase subunit 4 [Sepia latimanus]
MFVSMLSLLFIKNKMMWEIRYWILLILVFMSLKFLNLEVWGIMVLDWFNCDMVSGILVILTLWISSLMYLASNYSVKIMENKSNKFSMTVLILCLIIIMYFVSTNVLMFYIFFEVSLLPTLLLIISWGYQPERLQAGMYMMLYTISMSLPLLVSLILMSNMYNSYNMLLINYLSVSYLNYNVNLLWYLGMLMAFLVKLPMFSMHLWLPKAHVEAPIAGSMILAGILLKLGGYGVFRMLSIYLLNEVYFNKVFMIICLWGGLITSFICVGQSDVKSLIAYSSIGHMGLMLSGMLGKFMWGWEGAMLMMVCHGFCSSGLFCLANIMYEKVKTRSLFLYSGMININSTMCMWWFLFCMANMGAPPCVNMICEIMLFCSMYMYSSWFIIIILLMVFMGGLYNLVLFSNIQHGNIMNYMNCNMNSLSVEYLLLYLHFYPMLMFILNIGYLNKIFMF